MAQLSSDLEAFGEPMRSVDEAANHIAGTLAPVARRSQRLRQLWLRRRRRRRRLARGDCRIRSRSMAIRPLIARPVRFSASIPEGNRCEIRSSKYLNNLIEQDHRSIKLWLGPMLGFKRFRRAATTIAGIELMHRIRKGQFKLRVKNKTAPEIWNAALGA
jgi:hypothetical protein